ncbi:beta-methylarginine biosynthesis bifunctional aminotransferase [Saccharopolyspora lacisalsi]|uniref:Aminotransferase n=1 Tax=Halosaccharopolyspora lacisalsi TaxID=1000566 RepID=A0A839E936_9PSEU|nr:beta-methylarginine biosynthesis bifunctional aminotransferase [Halosaccharopolyspora lacisalsi]MBA8827781.1 beta-methylarginine biosynthesis bifunctional aminotransferase [Halosaccharopolyspora lacisalsi]
MRLTPLSSRRAVAAGTPGVDWRILAENIPVWQADPPMPVAGWDDHAQYAPSQGVEALLDVLCERERRRDVTITTECLLVTNGAFDGLGLIARHLAARGVRRAVCGGPVLLNVFDLFNAVGLRTVIEDFPVAAGGKSLFSLELGPSDLLYINTPHNPTGACLDERTVRAIFEAQLEFGFTLVVDLVYDSFVHDPAAAVSPIASVPDWRNVYAVNSFSKNYGAPGLRVGWLMAAPEEIEALTARIEWERIAVSSSAQHQAASLCSLGNAPLVERVRAGRELVSCWAEEVGAVVAPPQGGTHLWTDLLVGDAEVLADELMTDHGLIISTGANFYPALDNHVRIPYGVETALLQESLETIADVLRRRRG